MTRTSRFHFGSIPRMQKLQSFVLFCLVFTLLLMPPPCLSSSSSNAKSEKLLDLTLCLQQGTSICDPYSFLLDSELAAIQRLVAKGALQLDVYFSALIIRGLDSQSEMLKIAASQSFGRLMNSTNYERGIFILVSVMDKAVSIEVEDDIQRLVSKAELNEVTRRLQMSGSLEEGDPFKVVYTAISDLYNIIALRNKHEEVERSILANSRDSSRSGQVGRDGDDDSGEGFSGDEDDDGKGGGQKRFIQESLRDVRDGDPLQENVGEADNSNNGEDPRFKSGIEQPSGPERDGRESEGNQERNGHSTFFGSSSGGDSDSRSSSSSSRSSGRSPNSSKRSELQLNKTPVKELWLVDYLPSIQESFPRSVDDNEGLLLVVISLAQGAFYVTNILVQRGKVNADRFKGAEILLQMVEYVSSEQFSLITGGTRLLPSKYTPGKTSSLKPPVHGQGHPRRRNSMQSISGDGGLFLSPLGKLSCPACLGSYTDSNEEISYKFLRSLRFLTDGLATIPRTERLTDRRAEGQPASHKKVDDSTGNLFPSVLVSKGSSDQKSSTSSESLKGSIGQYSPKMNRTEAQSPDHSKRASKGGFMPAKRFRTRSPVALACGHVFCALCTSKMLQVASSGLGHSSFPSTSKVVANCPVCEQASLNPLLIGLKYGPEQTESVRSRALEPTTVTPLSASDSSPPDDDASVSVYYRDAPEFFGEMEYRLDQLGWYHPKGLGKEAIRSMVDAIDKGDIQLFLDIVASSAVSVLDADRSFQKMRRKLNVYSEVSERDEAADLFRRDMLTMRGFLTEKMYRRKI